MVGYDALLEVAERENGVLGLFLGGSRGKGANLSALSPITTCT